MRKTHLLIVLLFASASIHAQMSLGLNFVASGFGPLNSVIDRYNGLRPWLDKEMGNAGFMFGATIAPGFSTKDGKFAYQALAFRKNSVRLTAKGNNQQRDLSIRLWTVNVFDMTYYPLRFGKFSLGAGVSPIELSRLKIRGRIDDNEFETYWKTPAIEGLFLTQASSTPHIDFRYRLNQEKNMYAHFRLFWTLSWFNDEHMVFVNDKLNGSFEANNHYATQNMGINHVGFQFLLDLF